MWQPGNAGVSKLRSNHSMVRSVLIGAFVTLAAPSSANAQPDLPHAAAATSHGAIAGRPFTEASYGSLEPSSSTAAAAREGASGLDRRPIPTTDPCLEYHTEWRCSRNSSIFRVCIEVFVCKNICTRV